MNDRDTHFAGFAKKLWDEIEDKIIVVDESMARHYHPLAPEVSKEIQQLIAHRAYDLAEHTLEFTRTSLGPRTMKFIPDLTAWPEIEE